MSHLVNAIHANWRVLAAVAVVIIGLVAAVHTLASKNPEDGVYRG